MSRRMGGSGRSMRGAGQPMPAGRGGTYFTPDGPRRLPGAAPQYDRRPTIFYKSARARYWRGANLQPDRRENVGGFGTLKYKFWFRSPRGPASTGGFHIVEADLNNDPGGGGGGDSWDLPGGAIPALCPAVDALATVQVVYMAKKVASGSNFNPDNYQPGMASSFSYLFTGSQSPDPLYNERFLTAGGVVHYMMEAALFAQDFRPPITDWPVSLVFFRVGSQPIYDARDDSLDGLPKDGPLCEANGDNDFFGFGGNPNGGGDGAPRYTCTCPDYTRTEQPYLNPLWPSQRRSRSWLNSRAGSDGFCKHIYSAAFRLGDQEVVGRVPGGLLPPGEVPDFFKWLRWNNQLLRQQRARERAYARQQLGEARRAGEGARDRYYENLVRRTNEVLSRYPSDGSIPTHKIPGFGASALANFQYDEYAYQGLTRAGYDRNFERITPNNRPQRAVQGNYGGDAFDVANPRSRPVQTGTGFANPPIERGPVFGSPDEGPNPLLNATSLPLGRAIRPQNPITGTADLAFSGGVNRVGIVAGATNQLRRLRGPGTAAAFGNFPGMFQPVPTHRRVVNPGAVVF